MESGRELEREAHKPKIGTANSRAVCEQSKEVALLHRDAH